MYTTAAVMEARYSAAMCNVSNVCDECVCVCVCVS